MKQKDWNSVILCTSKVLQYNDKHTKALYRRCLAFINLSKFEQAEDDLDVLEELIPDTTELKELKNALGNRKRMNNESENLIYKKMFNKYVDGSLFFV